MKKKRTLLIDLDPQANTTLTFFPRKKSLIPSTTFWPTIRLTLAEVIKPTKCANLGLAPAKISLAKLEVHLVGQFDAPFRLKDALAPAARISM